MATKQENKVINECVDKLQAYRERRAIERGGMQPSAHEKGVHDALEDLKKIAEPVEDTDKGKDSETDTKKGSESKETS